MSARVLEPFGGAIDLGRHLRDGELLLSGSATQVLHSNFYSYTYPEAPFVDHHWLASVIFYIVWKWVGFAGLNLFYILLGAVTLLLFFWTGTKSSGFLLPFTLALVLMPILRARSSIRPEIFTFLLCAVFLWLLWLNYQRGSIPGGKQLVWFFVLQVLWVNLHSGFVFGPFFVGVFLMSELLALRSWDAEKLVRLRSWSVLFLVVLAACLVNPSGIRGALYPYELLQTRSFPVNENSSVFTLVSQGAPVELISILLATLFLGLSFALAAWKGRFVMPLFLLGLASTVLAWGMYRNHPLLGFLCLTITAINVGLSGLVKHPVMTGLLGLGMAAGVYINASSMIKDRAALGLGWMTQRDAAAKFFVANNLQGPILNNFNSGSYLIFHLFPAQRVYIDSRAEAYPADFLQVGYIMPMQSEAEWDRLLSGYQFNAIVFCWSSDWEDSFIARRMLDSSWATVFLEGGVVILLRRTPQNQRIIGRFEIPAERLPLVRPNSHDAH